MTQAYQRVLSARSKDRPVTVDYIANIFTDFMEMHGDRRFADDPAVVGGLAMLRDLPVTVIGTQKGKDTMERIRRNFGAPNPEGYRKAQRLMLQAEKFHRPVVCFVDTSGAFCGIGAEERGQGQAIAESMWTMMGLKVPVISVLIGEGGSGGALALAVADQVWMMENAIYSVISPEGCASILWRDAKRAPDAAECLHLTARDALLLGVTEKVIDEQDRPFEEIYRQLEDSLYRYFTGCLDTDGETIANKRYERFRALGTQCLLAAQEEV